MQQRTKLKLKFSKAYLSIFCLLGVGSLVIGAIPPTIAIEETKTTNCTIFTMSDANQVYFGNNEDESGSRRYTEIWFAPTIPDYSYGCAYLGFDGNEPGADDIDGLAVGGINTEGLCYDANGILPVKFVEYNNSAGPVRSAISDWAIILRECSSVEEVILWHQTHNMGGYWGNQIHWADSTGDAVIISPHPDGQVAFTRKESDYLVSTNFNPVDHSQGWFPCDRYDTVTSMLEDLSNSGNFTRPDLVEVVDTVHLHKTRNYIGTVYSNLFDLKTRTIYLYIEGDYEHEIVIDLAEELEQGSHYIEIPSLKYEGPTISAFGAAAIVFLMGVTVSVYAITRKQHFLK